MASIAWVSSVFTASGTVTYGIPLLEGDFILALGVGAGNNTLTLNGSTVSLPVAAVTASNTDYIQGVYKQIGASPPTSDAFTVPAGGSVTIFVLRDVADIKPYLALGSLNADYLVYGFSPSRLLLAAQFSSTLTDLTRPSGFNLLSEGASSGFSSDISYFDTLDWTVSDITIPLPTSGTSTRSAFYLLELVDSKVTSSLYSYPASIEVFPEAEIASGSLLLLNSENTYPKFGVNSEVYRLQDLPSQTIFLTTGSVYSFVHIGRTAFTIATQGSPTYPKFAPSITLNNPLSINSEVKYPAFGADASFGSSSYVAVYDDNSYADRYYLNYAHISMEFDATSFAITYPGVFLYLDEELAKYPLFSASGIVGMLATITGEFNYPSMSTDGLLIKLGVWGELEYAKFAASSELSYSIGIHDTEMTFASYGFFGTLRNPIEGNGSVVYTAFGATSELDLQLYVNSATPYPTFGTEFIAENIYKINSEVEYPVFRSTVNAYYGKLIFIEGSYPVFGASGDIYLPHGIDGDATYPTFGSAGEVYVPIWIHDSYSYPKFSFSGFSDMMVLADFNYPKFTASALTGYPVQINSNNRYPRYGIQSRVDYAQIDSTGEYTFPPFSAYGDGELTYNISVDTTIATISLLSGDIESVAQNKAINKKET